MKMHMRVVSFLILTAMFFVVGTFSVRAQGQDPNAQKPTETPTPIATETPTPTLIPTNTPPPVVPNRPGDGNGQVPPHTSMANCDQCGYCSGMSQDQVPDRWQNCRKCIYKGLGEGDVSPLDNKTLLLVPTPDLFNIYTDFGCVSTKPGEFAQQISSFFFSVVGSIAFLFFIYGAGVIATSRSDPGRLAQGRRIIIGAIVGLLFALFAVFILRFVGTSVGLPNLGG